VKRLGHDLSEATDTLAQVLSRFEAAREDPDFEVVAEQPGFDTTYAALSQLFQL
jgi:hypothetical protein